MNSTDGAVERHSLFGNGWDMEVVVYSEGDVDVCVRSGTSKIILPVSDLADIVAFVEQHGQVAVGASHD